MVLLCVCCVDEWNIYFRSVNLNFHRQRNHSLPFSVSARNQLQVAGRSGTDVRPTSPVSYKNLVTLLCLCFFFQSVKSRKTRGRNFSRKDSSALRPSAGKTILPQIPPSFPFPRLKFPRRLFHLLFFIKLKFSTSVSSQYGGRTLPCSDGHPTIFLFFFFFRFSFFFNFLIYIFLSWRSICSHPLTLILSSSFLFFTCLNLASFSLHLLLVFILSRHFHT